MRKSIDSLSVIVSQTYRLDTFKNAHTHPIARLKGAGGVTLERDDDVAEFVVAPSVLFVPASKLSVSQCDSLSIINQ